MFAITFDLVVEATEKAHPKGVSQAYRDVGLELARFHFERVQGARYTGLQSRALVRLHAARETIELLTTGSNHG
jgi:virulence-associated protein VapD